MKRLPRHIAIIMDGNGRWAIGNGKNRIMGHQAGAESVKVITEESVRLGLNYLTLYAFSQENWNRPSEEVNALMDLLLTSIEQETPNLMKHNILFQYIGEISMLPGHLQERMLACVEKTSRNSGLVITLAISYGSRWEIVNAAKKIAIALKNGEIVEDQINNDLFVSNLATYNIPDPELLIRTSGELRISNFLLYQLAYTELYFCDTNWPDFREEQFLKAIVNFQSRERRFGKTSEQLEIC